MSNPRPIATLVPALTKDILGKKGMLFGKMLAEWRHIAGEEIAANAVPLDLKYAKKPGAKTHGSAAQAVLHLAVRSGYALELSYQKSLLIERLNVFCGYPAVKDIKIVQQTNITANKKPAARKNRPLTLPEERHLDEMVAHIQENDLQSALKNLGKAITSRKS